MSNYNAPEGRRRRSDAQRSSAAVLDAAVQLLGRRPQASMEEIATEAGVSRQTVYAHYASREALLAAVVDRLTAEAAAALDALDLDSGSAVAALGRWLDASWSLIERYPVLLSPAMSAPIPDDDYERHLPVMQRLTRLVERGQRSGEFDHRLPATWLITAVISLGHAAGEEVRSGRMRAADAGRAYRESVLRVCVRSPTGHADLPAHHRQQQGEQQGEQQGGGRRSREAHPP